MRVRLWVLLLWVCFVVRGAFYVCALPIWEGFDEYAHYARIEYLAVLGREPLRTTPVPEDIAETMAHVPTHNGGMSFDQYWRLTPAERKTPFSTPQAFIYEAQQPPLFYWLSAVFYRLLGQSSLVSRVIFLRMFCVLLASVCVPIGFLIARQVFGNPVLALIPTALIAALPLLTFTATHISNDGLAIGLGTLVILLVLRRNGVALAAALGAALLTKAYFLAFLPPVILLLFYRTTRRSAAVALFGAVAIAGWWYRDNWIATRSLTGNILLVQPSMAQIASSIDKLNWIKSADYGWITFVWTGNWSFLALRSWMYHFMAVLTILALAGVVKLLWKGNRDIAILRNSRKTERGAKQFLAGTEVRAAPFALLSSFLASFAAALGYFALATFAVTGYPGAVGWYSCCVAVPFAIVMTAGLRSIAPRRLKAASGPILVGAYAALEIFGANIYLLPYYAGFVSHSPNGRLPALRVAQLGNGGFRMIFERLALYKPAWLTAPILISLWVSFLLATVALMAVSMYVAHAESSADP
jgi:4-amino-4-deoxy-L-arabinose transferase-like glycosyltransferase